MGYQGTFTVFNLFIQVTIMAMRHKPGKGESSRIDERGRAGVINPLDFTEKYDSIPVQTLLIVKSPPVAEQQDAILKEFSLGRRHIVERGLGLARCCGHIGARSNVSLSLALEEIRDNLPSLKETPKTELQSRLDKITHDPGILKFAEVEKKFRTVVKEILVPDWQRSSFYRDFEKDMVRARQIINVFGQLSEFRPTSSELFKTEKITPSRSFASHVTRSYLAVGVCNGEIDLLSDIVSDKGWVERLQVADAAAIALTARLRSAARLLKELQERRSSADYAKGSPQDRAVIKGVLTWMSELKDRELYDMTIEGIIELIPDLPK